MSVLISVLYCARKIFSFKYYDGIYGMTKLYELEDNTVDVLVLGSSHAFADVDTGVLWDEYGFASFVLGGAIQPIWNTYYYLKEALKTQTPQLIVLEAYKITERSDYVNDDATIIKNTYGMKWTRNKINAIKVSAPKEKWGDFLFDYTQYHARYVDLGPEDFLENLGDPLYENWKGSSLFTRTQSLDVSSINKVTNRIPLNEKVEEYYRKIIELARSNNIPVLVMASPYAAVTEDEMAIYNSIADIAEEYDVKFINYNLYYNEIGIDYSVDAADDHHLNYKGSSKFTRRLGADIIQSYDISDRRGDSKYASWAANAEYISSLIKNQLLKESTDLPGIIDNLKKQEYLLLVSLDGICDISSDNIRIFLGELGITQDINELYYINNVNGILYTNELEEETEYFRLDTHDICLSRKMDEASQVFLNNIVIDNVSYTKVKNGINVVVYNPKTKTVVDSFGLDMNIGYNLIRL